MGDPEFQVRDRVAVWVLRRRSERLVDVLFERFGESVLEAVGFGVDCVDPEVERSGEVELEQTMVAEQLQRDPLTGPGQPHAVIEPVLDEPQGSELLHHCGSRRRRDAHAHGERRRLYLAMLQLQLVDLA
jgi:hypothetical protein